MSPQRPPQASRITRIPQTPPVDPPTGHIAASTGSCSASREPVGYVVVCEEAGILSGPVIFGDLDRANTAQGIAAGHSPPGVEWIVYALTDITERPTNEQ